MRFPLSHISYLTSHISHLISHISHLIYHISHLISLLVTRILFQVRVDGHMLLRTWEQFLVDIVGCFVIPPCSGCVFTETDKVSSAFSFEDQLTTTLSQ